MAQPAAKQGDAVVGTDTHILMVPSPAGPVPTPTPMPFVGKLDGALSSDVNVENKPAAVKGSTGSNAPHVPTAGPFQNPPSNNATVNAGSATVFVNGKPLARNGDVALTCNDPADAPNGTILATSTVLVG
jgi:uncharacterized Zn-binding protein involved in type VI secretion